MSSFTTSMAVLALAAIGMAGWQAHQPEEPVRPVEIPSDPVLVAGLPGLPALPARIVAEPPVAPIVLPSAHSVDGTDCGLRVVAEAQAPALVQLSIQDACHPGGVFGLTHAGLSLPVRADMHGTAALALPALADPARIDITGPDGTTRTVRVDIPDLADVHRTAFAWDGAIGVAMHATGPGRAIHPDQPGQISDVLLGDGGHLAVLGHRDLGGMVQIYTHPRDGQIEAGVVRLSLVLSASEATCGHQIAAQRIELDADAAQSQARLQLSFPACDAGNGDLVLQNMFHDLRIARH